MWWISNGVLCVMIGQIPSDIVDHMENCSNMDDKGTFSSPFRMVNLGFPFHHMTSKLFLCENI